jgi:hypothetical protein
VREETVFHHVHALQPRLLSQRVAPFERAHAVQPALPVRQVEDLARKVTERVLGGGSGEKDRLRSHGRNWGAAADSQQH